jgi:hypothetical protein
MRVDEPQGEEHDMKFRHAAIGFGTLNCGQSAQVTGINVGDSNAWYEVNFPGCTTITGAESLDVTLTGGDVFDMAVSDSTSNLVTGVANFTTQSAGDYFIHVYEGANGTDSPFTGRNGLRTDAGVPGRRAMPDLGPFVPDRVNSVYLRSVLLNDRWQAEGG